MTRDQNELARAVSGWLARSAASAATAAAPDDPEQLLSHVSELEALHQSVMGLQHDAVHAARSAGCSWVQIGAALGVTKQAAQQRFRPRPTPPAADDLRELGPVRRADELQALADAGRTGWKLVETRVNTHLLRYTGGSYEVVRRSLFQPGALPNAREGWEPASVRFPDAFYQRQVDPVAQAAAADLG